MQFTLPRHATVIAWSIYGNGIEGRQAGICRKTCYHQCRICRADDSLGKKYDTKVSVAHYRRGLALFNKVKQLVQDGAIGKVKLIQLKTLQPPASKIITQTEDNWRLNSTISGGGLFHDLSPHQLDILYWIFGKPQEVYVKSANQGKTIRCTRFNDGANCFCRWCLF